MTAEAPPPVLMADLDETMVRRVSEIVSAAVNKAGPPPPHPVKDIVLPLAVVIGLIANALMIGIAWGKFSQRMDTYESVTARMEQRVTDAEKGMQALRDRMHDAERDIKDDARRFWLLDDYTRGRIDRLPYRPPPPARW